MKEKIFSIVIYALIVISIIITVSLITQNFVLNERIEDAMTLARHNAYSDVNDWAIYDILKD